MNYLIYAGVFSFGALALLIEARRNYSQSLREAPFKTHPILKDARIDELCTPTDGLTGFFIYSLLYLVSYVVILSSTELYDLLRSANLAKLEVGATTDWEGLGEDAFNLNGTEYAKPIFVSAFLIAVMSLSAMRPIENTVRSAAHRLAGIPRGVYRVIDALQTKSVMDQMDDKGHLTTHFKEVMSKGAKIKDMGNFEKETIDALRVIDTIYEVISPNNRSRHFPIDDVEKLDDMSDKLFEDMQKFRVEVENFQASSTELSQMHSRAFGIANDTKALFAVHYIRNHRSVKNVDFSTRLTKIVQGIDRNYNPEKNSLAAAAFAASFVSIVLVGILYYFWAQGELNKTPDGAKKEVRIAWDGQSSETHFAPLPNTGIKEDDRRQKKERFQPYVRATECFLRHSQARIAFGTVPDLSNRNVSTEELAAWEAADKTDLQTRFNTVCANMLKQGTQQHLRNTHVELFNKTLWDVFQGMLVTLCVVATAIATRAARLEQASWKRDWTLNRIPFLRLFGACLLPSLIAMIAATTGELASLLVDSGFAIPQSALVRFFNNNLTFLLMMAPLGFILAFGTIVIMDRHASHCKEMTVLVFGGGTGLFVMGIMGLVIFVTYTADARTVEVARFLLSDRMRDLFVLSFVPISFILFFAFFIEVTEEPELDANGQPISDSIIVRTWQRFAPKRKQSQTGGAS